MSDPKRLRMFAGPNGSGKSSVIRRFSKDFSPEGVFQLHHYVNADDLLRDLQSGKGICFDRFGISFALQSLCMSLIENGRLSADHPFLNAASFEDSCLRVPSAMCDARRYFGWFVAFGP